MGELLVTVESGLEPRTLPIDAKSESETFGLGWAYCRCRWHLMPIHRAQVATQTPYLQVTMRKTSTGGCVKYSTVQYSTVPEWMMHVHTLSLARPVRESTTGVHHMRLLAQSLKVKHYVGDRYIRYQVILKYHQTDFFTHTLAMG